MTRQAGQIRRAAIAVTLTLALVIPPLPTGAFAVPGSGPAAPKANERAQDAPRAERAGRGEVRPGAVRQAEPGAKRDEVIPEQWVVATDDGKLGPVRSAVARAGGRAKKTSYDGQRMLITAEPDRADAVLEALEGLPGVLWVEPLVRVSANYVPTDPQYPQQYGLPRINAPLAWDYSRGSSKILVAVVDTGLDYNHVEFAGRVDTANDRDFVNGDYDAMDDAGHGTHVAGIAAAGMNAAHGVGVAPVCRILPVKVLDPAGAGDSFRLAEGIRWATDKGASVINLSLGSPYYSKDVADAVTYALGKGAVLVAASGNDAVEGVTYPARLPGVIGVSATNSSDIWNHYSNYGAEVDLSAPGELILSTKNGGGTEHRNGTSMATPFVAGAAALLRSDSPALTYSQVAQRLFDTARDRGAAGRDDFYGFGMLDIGAAISAAPVGNDDDIPGVVAPASPVTGTLDAADTHDVFRVTLSVGQRLAISLTGPSGADFDLALYGPLAPGLDSATPLAASAAGYYPEQIVYTAVSAGVHYVDVRRKSGSGTYRLGYSVAEKGSDDRIPGVPLAASPVTGTLDIHDIDDVWAIPARAGQRLTLTLGGDPGTDFDLYLFGPDATDLDADPYEASALETGYPRTVAYTVPTTGVYFANAYYYRQATGDPGGYVLSYSLEDPGSAVTSLTLAGPSSSPVMGSTFPLVAALRQASDGTPLEGRSVIFELWDGAAWFRAATATTTPTGEAVAEVLAEGRADYRARFEGDATHAASTSAKVLVNPISASTLTLSSNVAIPSYGQWVDLTARLTDSGTSAKLSGRQVVLEEWQSGWTPVQNGVTSDGAHVFTVRQWDEARYRVRFAGDASHGSSVSRAKVVKPRVYLSTPWAPSSVRLNQGFTILGFLRPGHARGARTVQIKCYRYENRRWVLRERYYGVNADYMSWTRWWAYVRFPHNGRWRIRVWTPEDSLHHAAYSGWSRDIQVY